MRAPGSTRIRIRFGSRQHNPAASHTMPVSHEAYLAAYGAVSTLADVQHLAQQGQLGLSYDALQCILAQKLLVLSKQSMGRHRQSAKQYVQRYQAGESLVELAAKGGLSPTQMARVVLEELLGARKGKDTGALLKEVHRLPDERLRFEVAAAVEQDSHNGPYVDTVKRCIGIEYECVLRQKLIAVSAPGRAAP